MDSVYSDLGTRPRVFERLVCVEVRTGVGFLETSAAEANKRCFSNAARRTKFGKYCQNPDTKKSWRIKKRLKRGNLKVRAAGGPWRVFVHQKFGNAFKGQHAHKNLFFNANMSRLKLLYSKIKVERGPEWHRLLAVGRMWTLAGQSANYSTRKPAQLASMVCQQRDPTLADLSQYGQVVPFDAAAQLGSINNRAKVADEARNFVHDAVVAFDSQKLENQQGFAVQQDILPLSSSDNLVRAHTGHTRLDAFKVSVPIQDMVLHMLNHAPE